MPTSLSLDPESTALVLIDLQKGILSAPAAPYSSDHIVNRGATLAATFRRCGAPVVLVRVGWSDGMADLPSREVDQPSLPAPGSLPADWLEFADRLPVADSDILIVKRHWGAFTGTELDLQLRRRGISTVVLGGIATHMGVESTACSAWELSYSVVIAEDATTSRDAVTHRYAMENIFPRLARVRTCAQIKDAMEASETTHGLHG